MIVDSRVVERDREEVDALCAWAGPDRIRNETYGCDHQGHVWLLWIAVANPGSEMIQRAYPGDTIERHDDGLLVVMPVGIAERTVRAKM